MLETSEKQQSEQKRKDREGQCLEAAYESA